MPRDSEAELRPKKALEASMRSFAILSVLSPCRQGASKTCRLCVKEMASSNKYGSLQEVKQYHCTYRNYMYVQWNLSKMVTVLGSHLSKAASLPGP